MNKTKTILAAVGGVTLAAVAGAGFFAWSAASARTAALEGDESTDGLETVREKAERLMAKPVFPSAESVRALTEARDAVNAWKEEAFGLASRGDRRLAPTTDAAFKEFIVSDARRLQALPAGADKKTLAATFDFGPFKPYISEGKMPEQAELKELQRKWDDVSTLIEMLSEAGVDEVTGVELKAPETPKEDARTAKKGKKPKAKVKAKIEPTGVQPVSHTYVITCRMRPGSLVKSLNALAAGERFTVVKDFTIRRESDTVALGLEGEKKEETSAPKTGRRRRRGAAVAEPAAEKKEKAGDSLVTVVTDPAAEAPFETRLTVEVCDFRAAERSDEKKEGEVAK